MPVTRLDERGSVRASPAVPDARKRGLSLFPSRVSRLGAVPFSVAPRPVGALVCLSVGGGESTRLDISKPVEYLLSLVLNHKSLVLSL